MINNHPVKPGPVIKHHTNPLTIQILRCHRRAQMVQSTAYLKHRSQNTISSKSCHTHSPTNPLTAEFHQRNESWRVLQPANNVLRTHWISSSIPSILLNTLRSSISNISGISSISSGWSSYREIFHGRRLVWDGRSDSREQALCGKLLLIENS